jgi:hypothetical protein
MVVDAKNQDIDFSEVFGVHLYFRRITEAK